MTRTERLGVVLLPAILLALVLFPVSVAGFRAGVWEFGTAFLLLQANVILTLITLLLGIVLALAARRQRERSLVSRGSWVVLISVVVLALYAVQVYKARSHPFIHDLSTDTRNPPQFEAVVSLRTPQDHVTDYEGDSIAALQQTAYPDLQPLITPVDPEQAYIRLKAMIKARGWELVADEPQRGRLEAVVTSLLFGFKDDLVIRIRPYGEGARVDMRSASRIGRSDLGANAARLRALRQGFEE
ncbi:DUF1499 domain-containing protein [Aestuariirhabdus sp. LZHN29]|uniref:DUF1499 domain-containing protein n=1 Tax=Aestuariirhabdus sp. LZHN29 TaxID=3417462 RepID=UPI003CF5DDD5